jgi:hypothetical protein
MKKADASVTKAAIKKQSFVLLRKIASGFQMVFPNNQSSLNASFLIHGVCYN